MLPVHTMILPTGVLASVREALEEFKSPATATDIAGRYGLKQEDAATCAVLGFWWKWPPAECWL